MEKRTLIKAIAVLILLVGLSVLLYLGFGLLEQVSDRADDANANQDGFSYSDYAGGQIVYQSKQYIPKDSVESILVVGVDQSNDAAEDKQDSRQSDFLALLVMDKKEKKYNILYLNRDTMTDIQQTDAFGEVYGTIEAQLALAHVYGDGEKARCRNTIDAVENLLYHIDIDHYMSMTMDAVSVLNDCIGGVELKLMDDFTFMDERFVKDAQVTLMGDQALTYVRARGQMEDSSNLRRMERQQQYVTALLEKSFGCSEETLSDAFRQASNYMTTDCTTDQLSKMFERVSSYQNGGTKTLPGEAVIGKEFMEYYADEQALQALVIELFYEELT